MYVCTRVTRTGFPHNAREGLEGVEFLSLLYYYDYCFYVGILGIRKALVRVIFRGFTCVRKREIERETHTHTHTHRNIKPYTCRNLIPYVSSIFKLFSPRVELPQRGGWRRRWKGTRITNLQFISQPLPPKSLVRIGIT